MSQARCQENMARSLADKFTRMEERSKEEHGVIYKEIKENREKALNEFISLRQDINAGLTHLTNLLIGHIQKNGG